MTPSPPPPSTPSPFSLQVILGMLTALCHFDFILQGKTVFQAEIDIICELADFYRMHAKFALDMLQQIQPESTDTIKNSLVFRGMEGFIAAVAPFNFTAIGGNLAGTPALMVIMAASTNMISTY